ncbi:MAG TPA: hypothetical protein VK586_16135 [Streptosporangiaceae bacterium]|nr:hypothetical protein [Streptosporangiaceae bacterium]
MSTTAWRFTGTEGADEAVLRLQQLDAQELIDVQDVAVLRWPHYASQPTAQEHVTDTVKQQQDRLRAAFGDPPPPARGTEPGQP